MPPRGYKKGYVKHPETDEWVDPRVLANEQQEMKKVLAETEPVRKGAKITVVKTPKPKPVKDDLGPTTKSVKNDSEYAKVIISFKNKKGRLSTIQYTMADLNVQESISSTFENAKKKDRIHLTLDGHVLEKQ